ncbi:hypothetical protein ACIRP3_36755 [Streptomyces sp. NPDC101209]|uniref:hypothetical protein n=1 Tax=Streptomyces sp. NPDC101209 TaxID=3366129 RepID=UPI00381F812D
MTDLASTFAQFGTPSAVATAEQARGAAYDALAEAELKYSDVADDGWAERAQRRDADAARAATLDGKPLPTGPSHYERAAAMRGEAVGVLEALRTRAARADHAVELAWQQAAPSLAEDIRAAYVAAEKAYDVAEKAMREARGTMRSAATALVATKYAYRVGSKPLPRLDGTPPRDMAIAEFCRRFVAAHGLTIDSDSPEYVAVMADGIARLLPADVAKPLIDAGVVRSPDTPAGDVRTSANGTQHVTR